MKALREMQQSTGTGLKGSGRIGSLITPPSQVVLSESDLAHRVTQEFTEPGDFFVVVDGGRQRPAMLRCGELTAYSAEEINARKGTEYATGMVVHVFRGHVKYGTHIREGPGSFHYGGGEVFEGRWKGGVRHGLGGLYLPSGYSYEGTFQHDVPHGRGVETSPFGERYVGEFADGRPHGFGVMYYTDNGSRYEGAWRNGEKHGPGAVFYDNGDVYQGLWADGRREGRGTIHYSSGRSFAVRWHRDVPEEHFVPSKEAAPQPQGPPIGAVVSPLGTDLRSLRVVPDLWTEVHPAHFARVKQAFEALDKDVTGEIEMDYLESIWDPNNGDTLASLKEAATTVGADNTLELIEVLTGLYPHLSSSETRRWILTDLPLEYVLRLRGVLAGVQSSRGDGFYTLTASGEFLTRRHLTTSKGCVGGVRISRAMFVRNRILFSGERGSTTYLGTGAAAGGHGTAPVGSTGASFAIDRAAAADMERMTFPQLLEQVFPSLWKEFLLRCEVEGVPPHALEGYCRDFELLDEGRTGFLSLEAMKVAQRRFQVELSRGADAIRSPATAYERRIHRSIFKHQARWLVGDISVTVTLMKQVDSRLRSGFVSLAELLRFAFPNVPCLVTRERLGSSVGAAAASPPSGGGGAGGPAEAAQGTCGCSICSFCSGPRFNHTRPANPYSDGVLSW